MQASSSRTRPGKSIGEGSDLDSGEGDRLYEQFTEVEKREVSAKELQAGRRATEQELQDLEESDGPPTRTGGIAIVGHVMYPTGSKPRG